MHVHTAVAIGLSLALGACASSAAHPPDVASQDVGIELFDRDTLRGWRASQDGLWTVADEALVARASRHEHALKYLNAVDAPFRLHLSIAPLGQGPSDGKMVQVVDALGKFASVSLDDDVPSTLAIYADGAPGTRGRRMGGLDVPLTIGRAIPFTIEVDGHAIRIEHEGRSMSAPCELTPPLHIQLAVQRTGALFRGLVLSTPSADD